MTLPKAKAPVLGGTEALSDDLLAGDLPNDDTADLAAVAEDALPILVGQLLCCMPVPMARGVLKQLPAIPHPVLAWWVTGIQLAVDRNVIPNPLTASTAAITAGFPPPPGLRGSVVAAGWSLSAEATHMPFVCAEDLLDIVRGAEVRRAAERAVRDMQAAVWTADLIELAEVFQRHSSSVLAMLAEVTG